MRESFKKWYHPCRFLPDVVCGAHDLREATRKAGKTLEREAGAKGMGDSSYSERGRRGEDLGVI